MGRVAGRFWLRGLCWKWLLGLRGFWRRWRGRRMLGAEGAVLGGTIRTQGEKDGCGEVIVSLPCCELDASHERGAYPVHTFRKLWRLPQKRAVNFKLFELIE